MRRGAERVSLSYQSKLTKLQVVQSIYLAE